MRSPVLDSVSEGLGWSYFIAWSLSFYPQTFYNFRRKSVRGLSLDFQAFNILGYICYSTFTCALRFNPSIRKQYGEVYADNLVTIPDCFFAVHGAALTLITIGQCILYDRGGQRVAVFTIRLLSAVMSFTLLFGLIVALRPNSGPEVDEGGVRLFSWLCFIYWLSVIKLGVTFFKYVPQVYLNYANRSTVGWSISNVLLDFTGGVLSIAQLMFDGATLGWEGVVGDPIKFALGLVSIFFDIIFLVQHFCLYTNRGEPITEKRHPLSSLLAVEDASIDTSCYTENLNGGPEDPGGPMGVLLKGSD